MFTIKAKKHDVTVPISLVLLIAERLWRHAPEKRAHMLAAAKKRLGGKFPHKKDAAVLVAMKEA